MYVCVGARSSLGVSVCAYKCGYVLLLLFVCVCVTKREELNVPLM